jgi:hypothetical protein
VSDVDDIIDRQASPAELARVAAVIASDFRFAVFATAVLGRFFRARRSNGDLDGGLHLCLMDMTAFGASDGPVLEAGAGRRNALDRRATLASRAAG